MELPNEIFSSSQFLLRRTMDSEIFGSSDSLSLPSEPPEIRNWFPSYQYESPKLDSNDIFGGSVCEETEIGKEESYREAEDSEKNVNKFEQKPLLSEKKNDFSNEASLLSEPIDVRNWFSNYAYESPVLDTSDAFKDFVDQESEDGDKFDVERRNRSALEDCEDSMRNRSGNNIESSFGLDKSRNFSIENKQEKAILNKVYLRIRDESYTLEHGSDQALFQNREFSAALGDDSQYTLNFSRKENIVPLDVNKCSERSSHGIAKGGQKSGFSSPERSSNLVLTDTESTKRSARRCDDKENVENKTLNNGFVTTRRNGFSRKSEEMCLETPKGTCERINSLEVRKDYVVKREALAERTNFQHSSGTEITGKWKCPQKRKKDLGPPLKQLRLERWVQRI